MTEVGFVRFKRLVLSTAVACLVSLRANADTEIRVNSFVDAVDAAPGDGLCSTGRLLKDPAAPPNDGAFVDECTLRAAIQEVNASEAGPDVPVIRLYPGTYQLTLWRPGDEDAAEAAGEITDIGAVNDLDVKRSVTIQGSGQDVTFIERTAFGWFRVLDIRTALGLVQLRDLTIRQGRDPSGGGVRAAYTTTYLERVTLEDNTAVAPAFSARSAGGGLLAIEAAYVRLWWCRVRNNVSNSDGGGLAAESSAVLDIFESTIEGNRALGVGRWAARLGGGGVASQSRGRPFRRGLILRRSTVANNVANNGGGGVASYGDLEITNSTISGNQSLFEAGGGLFIGDHDSPLNPNTHVLAHVTITGNEGLGGGGLHIREPLDNFVIYNSLIARNRASKKAFENCSPESVPVRTGGGNLEDRNDCGFSPARDLVYRYPVLGPLADNGGPTRTHALLVGSPAIDGGGGPPELLPAIPVDQRGRPRRRAPDIGAFEFEGPGLDLPGMGPIGRPPRVGPLPRGQR
jgi:CSLREA domain-containing protein